MAKRKSTKRTSNEPGDQWVIWKRLGWTFAAGLWLLTVAALVSYDAADRPGHSIAPHNVHVQNWVGRFGAIISHEAYLMIGPGIWLGLVCWAAALLQIARNKPITQPVLRFVGVILMMLSASAMAAQMFGNYAGRPEGSGGLIALYAISELSLRFAALGTLTILGVSFWIGAILTADEIVFALPRIINERVLGIAKGLKLPNPVLVGKLPSLVGGLFPKPKYTRLNDLDDDPMVPVRRRGRKARIDEDAGGLGATENLELEEDATTAVLDGPEDYEEEYEYESDDTAVMSSDEIDDADADYDEDEEESLGDAPGAYIEEKKRFDPDALREKIKQMPINMALPFNGKNLTEPMREVDFSGYQFPGMDMLEEPESNFTAEMEAMVRDQAVQLESAMQEYRIEGEVVGIDSGPAITLFEIRLAPGTKVARLNTIASDLARAMRSQNIRVVPNMVGKDTVGIEVPNVKKEKVRLKELMTVGKEEFEKMKLPMFLGKDASGNPLICDLAGAPHMLIAGTTGSGKSVCMNSIIMSFLYTKRPDELKMVLVDPKMVEMSMFKDVPHLMCPVVTEMSKAAAILEWAVTKMDERYELLAEVGVRDIGSYNALGWDEIKERMNPANEAEEARIPKKLPYLVFIIDELADLMMTNKEVESFIVRIAQKARAVGIHLILATQRPQANVVTGLIKSNMPTRISFKVASGMDSRIVLDQKGAELLLGHGDMMYISPRSTKVTRAQGTLVDDFEIRKCVKFLKNVAQQNFEPQLVQLKQPGMMEGDEERDPLFEQAVEIVLETQRGSVSLLQRRLSIGYSRSSRLIEQMGQAGIIGAYKGSQAREVNVSLEEWEAMKEQMRADAESGGAASLSTASTAAASGASTTVAPAEVEDEPGIAEEEDEYEEYEDDGEYEEEDEYEDEEDGAYEEVDEDDGEYEYEEEEDEEEDEEV